MGVHCVVSLGLVLDLHVAAAVGWTDVVDHVFATIDAESVFSACVDLHVLWFVRSIADCNRHNCDLTVGAEVAAVVGVPVLGLSS